MIKYQKLIVYGDSLTKDNYIDTWADYISKLLDLQLENYAERGAGYAYIMQKVLSSPKLDNTLNIIMWPAADSFDLYVNSATPHLQQDIKYASWLDGKEPAFVDYKGQYNKDHGWYINGPVPRGYKNNYYKYFYNQTFHVNQAWTTILAVQSYFDSIGSNYIMCSGYPLTNLIQYHNDGVSDFNYQLYNRIDLDKFVDGSDINGFIGLSKKEQFKFFDPHHPDIAAHQWYADTYILPRI